MEKRAGEGSRANGINTTEGMSTGDGMSRVDGMRRVDGMNTGGMTSIDKQKPLNPEPETRNFRLRQQVFTQYWINFNSKKIASIVNNEYFTYFPDLS